MLGERALELSLPSRQGRSIEMWSKMMKKQD